MKIKVLFEVSTSYPYSKVSEEIDIEIDDASTDEEIDSEIEKNYDAWLYQNIICDWGIIEEEDIVG